ncbi:DUF4157 domain-containing protein [Streptomyces sp. NPDC048430]|uniref:eCIS core domain-containing protein n=1 Tax=Streptomyces sp. NPDC048430 TaxID=3155388 RepID=UPI0034294CCE
MRAHETPAPQPGDRSGPRRAGAPSTQAGRLLALQRMAGNAAVSRAIEEERHAHGPGCGHGEAAPSGEQPAVQRRVSVQEAISSPGSRPEPRILDKAQQAYGMSFDHVRLHTGPVAQRSAMEFNAVAYTTGSDIVSQKPHLDDETIFHELDHVRQQTMGPVAGTDNGAGAKVSHQDDPFEKQSAANGRKMAQGAAPDLSLPGSSAPVQRSVDEAASPVQRMLGFETEIDLPVQDAGKRKIPGDTDLASSKKKDFKVVSDSRSLPPVGKGKKGASYSNLEFVTGAVSVVGSQAHSGREELNALVDEIKRVRDGFYSKLHGGLADAAVALDLDVEGIGQEAEFAPDNGYKERSGRDGMGDGLFVHYSVGVPLAGIPSFFTHLRTEGKPNPVPRPHKRAWLRLDQAEEFARSVVDSYGTRSGKRAAPDSLDALNGYCQLLYTQVAAMADKFDPDTGAGQIKNKTVALSRSALPDARKLLPVDQQEFLARNVDDIVGKLAGHQEKTEEGAKDGNFNDDDIRQVDGYPDTKLIDYAKSALDGTIPEGHTRPPGQQQVFGGMREIAPHLEQGVRMVPMEIRHFGSHLKTWDGLKNELSTLASWANTSYEEARDPASRRRT